MVPDEPIKLLSGGSVEGSDPALHQQQEADATSSSEFPMPCTFGSLGAAMSGGALGFVVGFGATTSCKVLAAC